MANIPGLPGASQPSFRTGSRGWVSLDQLVHEVVAGLHADGFDLSPHVVKVTVQLTRRLVDGSGAPTGEELIAAVQRQLPHARVLLPAAQVERVVRAYAGVIAILDIRDTQELGP